MTRWIGGDESDYEVTEQVAQQRQIDEVRKNEAAARARGRAALEQVAEYRERLMELSLHLGRKASHEERAGNYELAEHLRWAMIAARQIHDRRPIQDLVTDGSYSVTDLKKGRV